MIKPYYQTELGALYCGDCLGVMPYLEPVDMILCDLPYGKSACKWDKVIPFEPLWTQYKRLIKGNGAIVLTASQPFTSALVMSNSRMFKYCWVWFKSVSTGFNHCKNMPMKNYEDVCVFSNGTIQHSHLTKSRMVYNPQGIIPYRKKNKRDSQGFSGTMERRNHSNKYVTEFTNYPRMILEISNEGNTRVPTQKPVSLMEYLIKTYTNEGAAVLDNCIGSGTTAVACERLGRRWIGVEKEEKYCEIAKARIEPEAAQMKMF